jgi:predicted ATPase
MRELPRGTVTFLFTDIEGSTRLLKELGPDSYSHALAEHRRVVRTAVARHGGVEVDTQGDAFFVAFPTPNGAVAAAREASEALSGPVRVRIGLHTGVPHVTDEGYVGEDVHMGARVAAAGHGGQVLLSRATRELVECQALDLGEHRLKDFAEPVWIFQLGREPFPPLKTISNTNLPRPASSFVGRESETAEVAAVLRDGARLVTLSGPGGSGKTRLAIEAAAELVPEFKNGVFWVGLAVLRDPALVTETISQTLGAKDGLADHVGERELLLLLDNLEQVIEAAPTLVALIETCPNLRLLVTSRELLRVRGEVEYAVPPLAEREAVELFCQRSQLQADETIAELCRRLDNLPLAVELAAARASVLSPAQILDRLSQRLDLLKGGRDAEARQQTLRATIEWSYELLSPDEHTLFRRLSVFAGGCTLEAAEQVADADLDTLQSLVDKSLVRHTGERFWTLETIREYASEQLAGSGEGEILAQGHLLHFLALAETAEPELWAQRTDPWLPRLDVEEANFRAALGWGIERRDAETAVRLAVAIYPFWEIRGRHGEAYAWLSRALALGGAVPPERRAKALLAAGRASGYQFDWETAASLLEEAADLCRRLSDVQGLGRCLGFIGHLRLFTGDRAGAAAALEEGVELARSAGDRPQLARALFNAAAAANEERDYDRAGRMYEEAACIARAEGTNVVLALSLIHLGYTAVLAGDFGSAARRLDEGVEVFELLGVTSWTAQAQRYLGLLALLEGKIEEAESILRTSLRDGGEQAPQQELPYWIEGLAAVAAAKGDAARAATLWGATDALLVRRGLALREEGRQVRDRFRTNLEAPSDGNVLADARAQGEAMTLEQAIAHALAEEEKVCP